MHLDKSKAPARLFFWSLGICDEYSDQYGCMEERFQERTNLCHFVRVVALYMPLVLALHVLLAASAVFALVAYPIYLFGIGTYIVAVGVIAAIAGAIALGIWMVNRRREQRRASDLTAVVSESVASAAASPGFWAIAFAWLKARKEKVCPPVTFVESGSEATHA